MKIRNFVLIAVLALTGVLATGSAMAQDGKAERRGARGPQMAKERVEYLTKELSLTAEQQKKVTALFEEQGKKMQEMRDLAPEERRSKMQDVRETQNKKMKEILTADQYTKWQEVRQRGPGGRGEGKGKREQKKDN